MILGSLATVVPVLALGALGIGGATGFLQAAVDTGALASFLDWAESMGAPVCRDCNPWLPL